MDLFVEPQGVLRGTAASQVQRLLLGSTGCVSAIWQAAWRLRFEHKSCKRNGWGPALTPCRLAVSLQVKNILYHCVKEAASSLRKSGSEKDDEEHNSWCLALSTPSSFCHGGLCHVTTINGWLKAGHVIQRTSQCDPHSCHTSSGQWEALPPLSSPQTFSAKRRQIEEQLGWEGWKPHRLQTQSERWLGASLEPVWWSESALQTSKRVCIQLKCSFHGGSDCRSSTGGAALTALDDKGQEL